MPLELLHPVFGQFIDDCNTHEITPNDNTFTKKLKYAMADIYEDVAGRITVVDQMFRSYGINLSFSNKPGYETVGDISVNGNCHLVQQGHCNWKCVRIFWQAAMTRLSKPD